MRKTVISGPVPRPEEARIAAAVRAGQDYMRTHLPRRTPVTALFLEQARYLSPWLIGLELCVLLVSILRTEITALTAIQARQALRQLAPLSAIFAVPELTKDVQFQMCEMEQSCKNRGPTLLLLRLAAVSGLNIFALTAAAGTFAWRLRGGFLEFLFSALTPYHFAVVLCLFLARLFRIRSRAGTLTLSLAASGAVVAAAGETALVRAMTLPGLILAFCGVTALLVVEIRQLLRQDQKGDGLLWSL